MKKTLISLAVAAALVPATVMADTSNVTVYGKVNVSYDRLDNDAETGGFVASNSSRIGFKGMEDLGDGLKAVFQYETAVNLDSAATFGTARDTFVGVNGNFGSVTVGRQIWNNLYKNDAEFFADGIGGPSVWLDTYGSSRANNTIKYATPNMSGFNASITYVTPGGFGADGLAGCTTDGENCQMTSTPVANTTESSYALQAGYKNGPLFVNVARLEQADNASTADMETTSIAASYTFGPGKVAAQWVKYDDIASTSGADTRFWTLGGSYKVSANGTVKASYTDSDDRSNVANTGADMFAIGYDHALSKRTSVYATYARVSNDSAGTYAVTGSGHGVTAANMNQTAGKDSSGLSLGMVHDF
jgi:predicted porin